MNINRLLSSFVLIVLSVAAAHAFVFGDVKGTVLDPQQRPVVAAKVSLLSRTSSFSRTTDTDGYGAFSFRAVPIGEYTVTVDSSGFSKSTLALKLIVRDYRAGHVVVESTPCASANWSNGPESVDSGDHDARSRTKYHRNPKWPIRGQE